MSQRDHDRMNIHIRSGKHVYTRLDIQVPISGTMDDTMNMDVVMYKDELSFRMQC